LRHVLLLLVGLLAACAAEPLTMQQRGPTRSVVTGNQRTLYEFYNADSWDIFSTEDGAARFSLANNMLEGYIAADRGYVMSRNHVQHTDVIVNAVVRQTEGLLGNGFGIVCRADEQANGYYFLLSSDGQFTISVGTSARDALFELIPWQYHSIIRQGFEPNEIRAVCAGNYLAMFINDVFVAEAFDDEFTAGELGVVIGAVRQPAAARFDNILVRDAILRGQR
jgi:hypothetical protein